MRQCDAARRRAALWNDLLEGVPDEAPNSRSKEGTHMNAPLLRSAALAAALTLIAALEASRTKHVPAAPRKHGNIPL